MEAVWGFSQKRIKTGKIQDGKAERPPRSVVCLTYHVDTENEDVHLGRQIQC